MNPNITWQIIQDNSDKFWRWECISQNINITWQIIHNNPDKPWDWEYLSINTFSVERNEITLKLQTKAANRIRNWYLDIYMRPDIYSTFIIKVIRIGCR